MPARKKKPAPSARKRKAAPRPDTVEFTFGQVEAAKVFLDLLEDLDFRAKAARNRKLSETSEALEQLVEGLGQLSRRYAAASRRPTLRRERHEDLGRLSRAFLKDLELRANRAKKTTPQAAEALGYVVERLRGSLEDGEDSVEGLFIELQGRLDVGAKAAKKSGLRETAEALEQLESCLRARLEEYSPLPEE